MAVENLMQSFLFQLGIIIIIATLLGIIARKLRQPIILAYILTGIIAGPTFLNIVTSVDLVYVFSQLGIAFLLFLVGLNMNYKVLREVGKISLITGVVQIAVTFIIGYGVAMLLGFQPIEASFIGIALTFSSTIIIVKLLADKNDLDSLYGKIAVGFLLVQDFAAIAIIIMLSGNMLGMPIESLLMVNVMKIVFLFCVTFVFGKYILPPLIGVISKGTEMLFLSGISWMFVMSILSMYLGFSIEIGALLAGISMASLPYHFEITGRIKPLKDFFLILFFVAIGTQMVFSEIGNLVVPAIIFSIFIFIAKPLIMMILMGAFGYKKRTGFLTGTSVAQISEFSLILIALGLTMGYITSKIVSMVTLVGLITIAVSSYFIFHNSKIYSKISDYLNIFERKNLREKLSCTREKTYDIVLIGYHRMGYTILRDFKQKSRVLVVDFNPTIIEDVKDKGFCCEYGDISDPEIMYRILQFNPKLIISTVPSYDDNTFILKKVREYGDKVLVFVTTNSVSEALEFYKEGADYVIVPHFLGGEKASVLLGEFAKKDMKDLKKEREDHVDNLRKYARLGQKHI
jgi:Kef-type K+ transport system membrane component KefB